MMIGAEHSLAELADDLARRNLRFLVSMTIISGIGFKRLEERIRYVEEPKVWLQTVV